MKLAIVVGHNSVSQGTVRQDIGESKFDEKRADWGGDAV